MPATNTPISDNPTENVTPPAADGPAPACPECQSADLVKNGVRAQRPYYRCRTCGKSSFGRPRASSAPPVPADAVCTACGSARLLSEGRETASGKRRYRCRDCGARTLGVPTTPRPPIPPDTRCTRCGGSDLARAGADRRRARNTPRYRCRACGAYSNGAGPRPDPPDNPCPYCRGRCIFAGTSKNGRRRRYKCRACGRTNTDLWPRPTARPTALPLVRRALSFGLDIPAHRSLIAYCQNAQLPAGEAVRAIFRDAARSIAAVSVATAPRRSHGEDTPTAPPTPRHAPPAPFRPRYPTLAEAEAVVAAFPFHRGEHTRARLLAGHGNPRHLSVAVLSRVAVRLDPLAVEGLVRVMHARKIDHQQAARYLIAHARVPEKRPLPISDATRTLFAAK